MPTCGFPVRSDRYMAVFKPKYDHVDRAVLLPEGAGFEIDRLTLTILGSL